MLALTDPLPTPALSDSDGASLHIICTGCSLSHASRHAGYAAEQRLFPWSGPLKALPGLQGGFASPMHFSHHLGQTSQASCLSVSDYYIVLCCKGRRRQLSVCCNLIDVPVLQHTGASGCGAVHPSLQLPRQPGREQDRPCSHGRQHCGHQAPYTGKPHTNYSSSLLFRWSENHPG